MTAPRRVDPGQIAGLSQRAIADISNRRHGRLEPCRELPEPEMTILLRPALANFESREPGSTDFLLSATVADDACSNRSFAFTVTPMTADTFIGTASDDNFEVDDAADAIIESAGGGTDTVYAKVSYTLPAHVENLILADQGELNGTGNSMGNVITGNRWANVIDGGAGADTMVGDDGDDTYIVDNAADVILESSPNGYHDLVLAGVSYVLPDNVEDLTLTGNAAIDGTGNRSNNHLIGTQANNVLDGGAGQDMLEGGAGNDRYVSTFQNLSNDYIVEAEGEGIDTVEAYGTKSFDYWLDDNVENLIIKSAVGVQAHGNGLDNKITGSTAAEILDGGLGKDTLTGAAGDDVYTVDDTGDVVVEQSNGGIDTVYSSVSWTLGKYVENLTLTGESAAATGNSLGNIITANDGDQVIDGKAGADTMDGGNGTDIYIVDNVGDVVNDTGSVGGRDLIRSSVSFTLNFSAVDLTLTGTDPINGTGDGHANHIVGNSADNVLNGGLDWDGAADTLVGGDGNDTYIVNGPGHETVITETATGGIDTVVTSQWSMTLAQNVENLTLDPLYARQATGNSLANSITGNDYENRLNGLAGSDTLTGGGGDDTYVVDDAGDKTIETSAGGNDLVESSISFTLQAEVENLTLTGTSTINGTGNALVNTILGNSAANVLNGGAGADSLTGGAGNDTYIIDSSGDRVVELANGGHDLVRSSVSCALATEVEDLTLTGTATSATGNTSANVLVGNGSANVIDGKAGADRMTGGAGADIFAFTTALASDLITDFTSGIDRLRVSQAAIRVGDGDTEVEGAVAITGPNGFSTSAELVIVGHNILGDLSTTSAATAIGRANSNYAIGDTRLFVVDNGSDSAVYLFKSGNADSIVSANELTLMTTLDNTASTSLPDYIFGA
ncbi:calcium-binding protein [Ideonella sp. DXS29W]|uniref:Calcium-binding protein n=1 Tax=Ideonella lacteola TaxID=2984193 RepID=A0ABU9BYG5_9BURK